ncbi:MAG: biotin/lipoyl-binding protein, partial [Desulfonatronovibrio sp.]
MKVPEIIFILMLWFILIPVSLEADDQDYLVFEARAQQIINYYEAVGTVSTRHEPAISSRVQAEVLEVIVNPGDKVQPGELMIILDDREFKSRLNQAMEQLQAAGAAVKRSEHEAAKAKAFLNEVSQDYERYKKLHSR